MNAYNNSWPEEQQHLQRHQDLLREAEQRRLMKLARPAEEAARPVERDLSFLTVFWGRLRCRLSGLAEHLPARVRPAAAAAISSECR